MQDLVIEIPVSFYFASKTPVPIPAIVKSLQGIERLAETLPIFFTELSGAQVDSCTLSVTRLESGSLIEDLKAAFSFVNKEDREKFLHWINTTKMGKATSIVAGATVATFALMVVASEALSLYDRFTGSDTPSIQENHGTVIIAGGNVYNVPADKVESAARAAVQQDSKRVVGAAIDFVRPASGPDAGHIYAGLVPSENSLRISHDAARDAPAKADFSVKDHDVPYENVAVDIRIVDRDRPKGWAALVPSVAFDKKLPLSFAEGVDMEKAKSQQVIQANIRVTYSQDPKQGTLVPKSILIVTIL